MSKVQILVATMHRQDFSIIDEMNIRCDAIVANQADTNEFSAEHYPFGTAKMITTATRGVGLNRNIALMASSKDILLIADDDMRYNDDMPQKVSEAFDKNTKADVIIFGVDFVKGNKIVEKRHLQNRRLHLYNAMRFGACSIAVRRSAILRENITFHQQFGGGCHFSSGEDSLFIKACLDHKLKIYSNEYVLGTCCKDSSSWFTGFGKKFFYDKGVFICRMFPKVHYLTVPYFVIRFHNKSEISAIARFKMIMAGIRNGKDMQVYHEENEKNIDCKQ